MKVRLHHIIQRYFEHKALVLMYHRVAVPEADIWDIAVSPENFDQQLQVLRKTRNVVPLQQLVDDLKKGRVRKNATAITFDDGYIDNYQLAKPLLEKHQVPATFFITSSNIGKTTEFWWDELEHLILFSERLPRQLNMPVNGKQIIFDLQQETKLDEVLREKHCGWKASEQAPPTLRCALFLNLWQSLRPLPINMQQELLQRLRDWAGVSRSARENYRSVSEAQLQQLSQSSLFEVGAHTVSHPALAFHSRVYQQEELLHNTEYLKKVTGQPPCLLAYPYGNYNQETMAVAAESGFGAAFTTEEKPVTKRSSLFRLGRVQAKNCAGPEFSSFLKKWNK